MPAYFDETHRLLRESVKKFVERRIAPHVDEWEAAGEFPRELYREAAEAGFLGLGYPAGRPRTFSIASPQINSSSKDTLVAFV